VVWSSRTRPELSPRVRQRFYTEYAVEEYKTKEGDVIISKSLSNDKQDKKCENTDDLKDGNRQDTKALLTEVSHHVVEQQEISSSINEKESKIPNREEDSSKNNNDGTKNNNNNMTILLNKKKPSKHHNHHHVFEK